MCRGFNGGYEWGIWFSSFKGGLGEFYGGSTGVYGQARSMGGQGFRLGFGFLGCLAEWQTCSPPYNGMCKTIALQRIVSFFKG